MDIKVKFLFLIISIATAYFVFNYFKLEDQKNHKYSKVLSNISSADEDEILDSHVNTKRIRVIQNNSPDTANSDLIAIPTINAKSALDSYLLSNDDHFKNKMTNFLGSINSDETLSIVYDNMDYSDVRLFSTFVSMASIINTYKSSELLLLSINNINKEDVEEYMSGIKILYSNAMVQDTLIHIDNFIKINSYYPSENQVEFILYIANKVSSKQGVEFLEKNLKFFNNKEQINTMIKDLRASDSRTFK